MADDRRSTSLNFPNGIELGLTPLVIRGYNTDGEFVCRLEVNSAGVKVHGGANGQKFLCNVTWEGLVGLLEEAK